MCNQKFYEDMKADEYNIHSNLYFKTQKLINEINKEFEPYFKIYEQIKSKQIAEDKGIQSLRNKLSKLNGQELGDLNYLCKMYSTTNCGWQEYQLAQIVHYIILELFDDIDYIEIIMKELNKC